MPTKFQIDSAIQRWQTKHNQPLSYETLAHRAGTTVSALRRMNDGKTRMGDSRKILSLCKALECEPGDLIIQPGDEFRR
jgi:DNA-binding Xre family transcriptional regulator